VWKVHRSARGAITNLEKKREYVYHYSYWVSAARGSRETGAA